MLNIDFNNIRSINGSANEGFEEFVCQLARREEIPCTKTFVRKGKPDGGVECYWTLEDGSIVAWQAKYFCKAFDDSQYQQIDRSVKEALDSHPNLRRYVIAVPTDPSDAHVAGRMSMKERIDGYVERWSKINSHVTFDFWWASDLIERLQKSSNQGLLRFWFGKHEFSDEDMMRFNAGSIKDLGKRYTPKLNIEVEPVQYFEVLSRGSSLRHFFDKELIIAEDTCRKIEKDKYCQDIIIDKGHTITMKKYNYGEQKNISGERIRQLRKANKMSQNQLAIKMQTEGVIMEQDVISRIESGQRILVDYELFTISHIFNVSSDWLIGLTDEQN